MSAITLVSFIFFLMFVCLLFRNTVLQFKLCVRGSRMKVRLSEIFCWEDKFLYFQASRALPLHWHNVMSSENRVHVSQT